MGRSGCVEGTTSDLRKLDHTVIMFTRQHLNQICVPKQLSESEILQLSMKRKMRKYVVWDAFCIFFCVCVLSV